MAPLDTTLEKPVHPGRKIRNWALFAGLSDSALRDRLGMPVGDVLRGSAAILPQLAARLSVVLGETPEYWLGLQSRWNAARQAEIASHPRPLDRSKAIPKETLKRVIYWAVSKGIPQDDVVRESRVALYRTYRHGLTGREWATEAKRHLAWRLSLGAS